MSWHGPRPSSLKSSVLTCRDCASGIVYGQTLVNELLSVHIKPGKTPAFPYDLFVDEQCAPVSTHDW